MKRLLALIALALVVVPAAAPANTLDRELDRRTITSAATNPPTSRSSSDPALSAVARCALAREHTYYVSGSAESAGVLVHNASCPNIPGGYQSRIADNGKGTVWEKPGSTGNADNIRIMEPTQKYPNGYYRTYNEHGQPVNSAGKPGSPDETHFPLDSWPWW